MNRSLGAFFALSLLAACDKPQSSAEPGETAQQNTGVAEPAEAAEVDPREVPAAIRDACLVTLELNTEIHLRRGFKFADIMREVEASVEPTSVSWEQSRRGHIWRIAKHNDLQNTDVTMAIEFVTQKPRSNPPYPDDECGPVLIRSDEGLINGATADARLYSQLFYNAVDKLNAQRKPAEPAGPAATSEVTGPEFAEPAQ